jgi:hypothetical protein
VKRNKNPSLRKREELPLVRAVGLNTGKVGANLLATVLVEHDLLKSPVRFVT